MAQEFVEDDCGCIHHSQDAGGGYFELLLEANPDCPEHGVGITDSEKLDYLYQVAKRADKLMNELEPQIKPFLDGLAKNPMLKMLGLGK